MEIPNCYDPVYQEERREAEADRRTAMLSRCCLCDRVIRAGSPYRECLCRCVCEECFEELTDTVRIEVAARDY